MSSAVHNWIEANTRLLEDAAASDARKRAGLSDDERWDRIRSVCRAAATVFSASPAVAAREADVERDHARWNELMDTLRGTG